MVILHDDLTYEIIMFTSLTRKDLKDEGTAQIMNKNRFHTITD
jgi:hypothetical protein